MGSIPLPYFAKGTFMKYVIAFLALFACSASATELVHRIQIGTQWSTTNGHSMAYGQISETQKTHTSDQDRYNLGSCYGCWEVDNLAAGESLTVETLEITQTQKGTSSAGESGVYCETSVAVDGLVAMQSQGSGSGWSEGRVKTEYEGARSVTFDSLSTSGNGGAEDSFSRVHREELWTLEGQSITHSGGAYDYDVRISSVGL